MAEEKSKQQEEKKKARKKVIGLAAAAAAAAVTPAAAEVIVQKTQSPAPALPQPVLQVPEPPRYEYSKPRPLKTIGDLLKGIFGVGSTTAESQESSTGQHIKQHNQQIRDWNK